MKAKTKLVVCNALFVGLIALLGSLPVNVPTSLQAVIPNLYAGGIGFSLAFLSQIKTFLEKEISDEEKGEIKAVRDKYIDEAEKVARIERHKKNKTPPRIFGIILPVCW